MGCSWFNSSPAASRPKNLLLVLPGEPKPGLRLLGDAAAPPFFLVNLMFPIPQPQNSIVSTRVVSQGDNICTPQPELCSQNKYNFPQFPTQNSLGRVLTPCSSTRADVQAVCHTTLRCRAAMHTGMSLPWDRGHSTACFSRDRFDAESAGAADKEFGSLPRCCQKGTSSSTASTLQNFVCGPKSLRMHQIPAGI